MCRNKVAKGAVRCNDCYEALSAHNDPNVRRLLAQERGLPAQILEQLLTDPDILVAGYAESRKAGNVAQS